MGLGKKFMTFAAVTGVMVIGGGFATAATNESQTVSYEVSATRTLNLDDNAATIAAIAKVNDSETSGTSAGNIDYTTDAANDKITADLDAAMETNLTLTVTITNTTAGTCTDNGTEGTNVDLSDGDPHTVISAIDNCSVAPVSAIQYQLASDASSAATPGSYSKTVTYTIAAT